MAEQKQVEILLVEDNPSDVELTLRALNKHNLANKVLVIADGEEALEYIFATGRYKGRNAGETPRVIFLDIKLPKVDGIEVLKQIKANDTTKLIPVVIVTSSREEQDVIKSYKLGANSYVVKPVDFEKFSVAITELGMYWLVINQPPK
jgi:two-component system response regulator